MSKSSKIPKRIANKYGAYALPYPVEKRKSVVSQPRTTQFYPDTQPIGVQRKARAGYQLPSFSLGGPSGLRFGVYGAQTPQNINTANQNMQQTDKNRLTMVTAKVGEKVVLWNNLPPGTNTLYREGRENPYFYEGCEEFLTDLYSGEATPVVGSITVVDHNAGMVHVTWEKAHGWNIYSLPCSDEDTDIGSKEQMLFAYDYYLGVIEGKKKVVDKVEIKADHLDRLIIEENAKKRILSVIKQHGKAGLIFDTWGLNETIEYGRGMTMLFYGPPGTGKTFGAKQIAKTMNKELMVFDTASLQSSVPGQMERNLKKAFLEAKKKGAVILFDECDSMIMSRDNVGMVLGSEINCLLTEIEQYEGVCILTTNRIGELDKALERRISLIVRFPKPSAKHRLDIWKSLIPKKLPLHDDVSLEALAEEFDLTGGIIKNVVLNAARLAAADDADKVSFDHFLEAIKGIEEGKSGFEQKSKSPTTRGRMVTTADIDRPSSR